MKVWFVTCILLFVLVQFLQWLKGFVLPLPLYLLAGALLSLASNFSRLSLQPRALNAQEAEKSDPESP